MSYTEKDQIRDLEYELDELRRRDEDRQERESREREQRDRERHEQMEERLRMADSWPDALHKQIQLFGREIAEEAKYVREYGPVESTDPDLDNFFVDGRNACQRALVIWGEVEKAKAEKRTELQRQMNALEDELRLEVADRLEAESDRLGWKNVAKSIREQTPDQFLYW